MVGIFPDPAAIIHLVGAVLAEQTDEWSEVRRYIGPGHSRQSLTPSDQWWHTGPECIVRKHLPQNLHKWDNVKSISFATPPDVPSAYGDLWHVLGRPRWCSHDQCRHIQRNLSIWVRQVTVSPHPGLVPNLEQKRDRMRRIFRGLEAYGEGTAAEQANRYRLEEMYPDVVLAARGNSANVDPPEVDLLVSLSGFSPETTLLAFELVRPPRLLVISSENTRHKVDVIHGKLGNRLAFSNFEHRYCDPADPVEMYEFVKQAVRPHRSGESPLRAIIDITGGKKVMSAGAALAAAQLDLPMCYVDSEFDAEMRQALPGTERLLILPNPTALFGDKDMDSALAMFRVGVYSGARARFDELSRSVSEPARSRFLGDLTSLYQAWCDLDSASLLERADALRSRIADPRSQVRPETARRLSEQLDFVGALVAKDNSALLLNFYLLGQHYLGLERYDFASLLFYRTIEKSLSERLNSAYGFDVGNPDYTRLHPDADDFTRSYGHLSMKVFRSEIPSALPRKVALVEALLLLYLVEDEMLSAADINGLSGVVYIRGLVEGRNKSVLAHGTDYVTEGECEKLRQRALRNLHAFWRLHHSDQKVDDRIETLRFVDEV